MIGESYTRARLYQALDKARVINSVITTQNIGESMSIYPVLAGMNDLDTLPGELGEPDDGNGLVKMADADELYLALHIAADELGVYNSGPEKIAKVGHEHQHAEAARALGLRAIHAVRFVGSPNGMAMKVTTLPVGDKVSKLGFASILAHPIKLSRSDQRKLELIGYAGATDIAKLITQTGTILPIPLSVK